MQPQPVELSGGQLRELLGSGRPKDSAKGCRRFHGVDGGVLPPSRQLQPPSLLAGIFFWVASGLLEGNCAPGGHLRGGVEACVL